jgi:Kef-type K+ transport system membrane component KefB
MDVYFPTEFGEQLAFGSATFCALAGLFIMLAPGLALSFHGLALREGRGAGLAAIRSAGGFLLGFGLCAILVAQPMVYLALGGAIAMSALARLLSLLSDRGSVARNLILMVVQIVVGGLPLAYVFGLV